MRATHRRVVADAVARQLADKLEQVLRTQTRGQQVCRDAQPRAVVRDVCALVARVDALDPAGERGGGDGQGLGAQGRAVEAGARRLPREDAH